MREQLARIVAALTAMIIVAAVLSFGALQNRSGGAMERSLEPERIEAGRKVYQERGCSICHSIAGEGDNQFPLDGVGGRMNLEQLRDHVAPPDLMRSKFPEAVFEIKADYRSMAEEEMDVLLDYLSSLR